MEFDLELLHEFIKQNGDLINQILRSFGSICIFLTKCKETADLNEHIQIDFKYGDEQKSKKEKFELKHKLVFYNNLFNDCNASFINYILLIMFSINQFRNSIFKLHNTNNKPINVLHDLFRNLQADNCTPSSHMVIKEIGFNVYGSLDKIGSAFIFVRKFFNFYERLLKKTSCKSSVSKLFYGKMMPSNICQDKKCRKSRSMPFYDIQLDTMGNKNVMEALNCYVNDFITKADNGSCSCGKPWQKIENPAIFVSFPPVLFICLQRSFYVSNKLIHVNLDRFEFEEKLYLNDFLKKPEMTPAVYTLQSVLACNDKACVEEDFAAFIHPECDGAWQKFKKDSNYTCTKTNAIDENFGGNPASSSSANPKTMYACMLVYVRDTAKKDVFEDVVLPCQEEGMDVDVAEEIIDYDDIIEYCPESEEE